MAAVGPPPGIVFARDALHALHGAGHTEVHPADAARQRFAHARRVLETIKHGVDSASAALALAEDQLTTATPPSSRYDRSSGVCGSALVAVNPGPWSPTQDQRVGDVPVDALIASRPTSCHGCDASHNEAAPFGFAEHRSAVSDIQDHITLDECSLVRPAHIRKDSTARHHAHHSPGPPSPALLAAPDKDSRSPSASQDGRPYDAEEQTHDEHVTSRNNAQTCPPTGASACGAYDTSACAPPDLNPEVVRLAQQQELRQQVWEAKKRALEAEAARVRDARSGSAGSSKVASAEVDAVLPPSLTRRSTSSARRHSSPAPPRRLVDRIDAPRLVDRIAPRRASIFLIDRIEPLPSVEPPSQASPPETQSTSLIDRIERTPCASPWRSPPPSLDESCSPSVDESEDPATDGLEDLAVDQFDKNRNLTPTVRSPSPLVLSPTPHASSGVAYDSSGAAYDSFGAVYDGSSSWSEVDAIIHEAVNKSPSNGTHRSRYNADQAGWTPASPATSADSAITCGVEEIVVDEEEMQVDNEETDSGMVIDGRDGHDSQIDDEEEGVRTDDGYDGEMPMEFSEDEGGDDDPSAAPEEPPTTPTEPGSPALSTLPFFEDVPVDGPSPPSSPAPLLVENRARSPYASRVQGLLESTSKAVSQTITKGQAVYGSQGGGGQVDRSPVTRSPSSAPSTPEGCDEMAVFAPANALTSGECTSMGLGVCVNRDRIPRPTPLRLPIQHRRGLQHTAKSIPRCHLASLANSMSSATARDIKTIARRPPVTRPTVGARLVAASTPHPGQVVTFAQLGAGYRLTSAVLEAAETEGASESNGDQDSSDSDLDSLFDEIPENEFDEGCSHASEHPNSSDPRLFRQRRTVMEDARSEEMHAKMNALALEAESGSQIEPPLLPAELVDEIVAQLPYRSAILKKCCLVARSWVTPCRARLFAHLSVYPRAYPSDLLDLSNFDLALTAPPTIRHQLIALLAMPTAFAAAPDIPQYVRGLSVQMMRLATPSDRAAAAEAAVQVLKLFPRLHTLTLDARALDYPDFSPALQSALCSILDRPGLTSLHLREQDVTDAGVHALLRSARHLRRLSIWPRPLLYVRLDGEDVPALPAGAPRPQLHTLHLVGPFDAALAWASAPHCPLDLRALRTLSLSPRRAFDMGGAFARFAAAHGAGVRTLVVSLCDVWSVVGNDVGAAAGLAFLDHMPALRIIRVKDGVLAPWSLVCAVRLLEVAVRKTGVEVFELRVAIWSADADSYRRKEIHLDHWKEVDSRLAVLREESSLRRMDFVAVPDEEASREDADRLQNWVEYALPKFAAGERDILHYSAVDGGMPWDESTAWDRGTVWADTD
uniref:F-box domain-containing protein n=1 Tax=Schizophyllum commune (strain H4-8 / FGSC 9210) TaxID=578458 RepID=D8QF88_SCHCM